MVKTKADNTRRTLDVKRRSVASITHYALNAAVFLVLKGGGEKEGAREKTPKRVPMKSEKQTENDSKSFYLGFLTSIFI